MAYEIKALEFAPETFRRLWGVEICDYSVNGVDCDFETMIVGFSTNRAAVIEKEVNPLSTRVQNRNNKLKELGDALADLSAAQQAMAGSSDDTSKEPTYTIKSDTLKVLQELSDNGFTSTTITKSKCEEAIQLVKSKIDKLNNDASSDMTNLQSLIDKRDESFQTASTLMQAVSDTRSNAIRNIQ